MVKGELDIATAADLLRRIDVVIDADPGGTVVVDFADVSFVDSTGLGVLVVARKRALAVGGALQVRNVSLRVRQVFEVTGLDHVLFEPA